MRKLLLATALALLPSFALAQNTVIIQGPFTVNDCVKVTARTILQSAGPCGSLVTPGGSTTQLQYNNAGVFGGISGWTTNGTTALTGGASTTLAVGNAAIGGNAFAVTGASTFGGGALFTTQTSAANFVSGASVANQNPVIGDPTHLFEIVNNATSLQVWRMSTYGAAGSLGGQNNVHFFRAGGTAASPTAVLSGDLFMSMGMRGWDGSASSQSAAAFQSIATENWNSTAHGAKFRFEATANGSTSRTTVMDILAAGPTVFTNLILASAGTSGINFTGTDQVVDDMTIYYDRSGTTLHFRDNNASANRFSLTQAGAVSVPGSLALGGATIGSNALAVTGSSFFTGNTSVRTGNGLFVWDSADNHYTRFVYNLDGRLYLDRDSGTATIGLGSGLLIANSTGGFRWAQSTNAGDTTDLFLTRAAAAKLQLGDANAASPVAQTLQAQGSRSGTDTNVAGGNLTIASGQGTGNAASSKLFFQTPAAVASGTGAQTMTNRLTYGDTSGTWVMTGPLIINAGSVQIDSSQEFKIASGTRFGQLSGDGTFYIVPASGAGAMFVALGGGTSSFPALKRSSTTIQGRLADDSAFGFIQGKLTTDTNYTAGTTTATGYITLYDATGTAYKVNACLASGC